MADPPLTRTQIISDLKHRLGSLETDFAALKYASLVRLFFFLECCPRH